MTPEERAYAAADLAATTGPEDTRRLSAWRILGVIVVIAAATLASVAFRTATHPQPRAVAQSSFMPYVDVTATPQYPFEDAARSVSASLVLGFVVSLSQHPCTPSWGAAYSLAAADSTMDLDRRIVRLRQRGGQVAVSFGGAANSELAISCTTPAALAAAYRSVIRRYSVDTIDLDIEGAAASAPAVAQRRAQAVRLLQQSEKRAGRSLQVWLTLPVDPNGLTSAGRSILADTLRAKVTLAGVNAMTMDYGGSLAPKQSLPSAGASALTHLGRQLIAAYQGAGLHLTSAGAWQHIGTTPMIGQNDVPAERFGLSDARTVLAFAQAHHLRRLSMWSVNRDQACGPNYANIEVVSDNCSGVDQSAAQFTTIFSRFRSGRSTAAPVAAASPMQSTAAPRTAIVDNPATSPYAIWTPAGSYPAGTKIVWHRNVYQAKWWSHGDTPDEPVAAASDTPWTLIGPVLPGEHPKPTPTLSAGTYPAWSATTTYHAGDRVMFDKVGYQAKWYTQGDAPDVVVSDPGQTPWTLITAQ